MTEQEAIMIIQDDIKTTKIKEGLALNLACEDMEKILVIKDILNECYEGWIADQEAIGRIKDLID